jgi:transposase
MSRLDEKTRKKIRQYFKETGSLRAVARRAGVSRNAVRRQIRGTYKVRASSPRPSKLDPYKAKIDYLVKEKKLSGVRILEEIQAIGYTGGYSIVKDYIHPLRSQSSRGPTAPIEHPPGHEAQMDWSPHRVLLGGRLQLVHTGSFILCFSRWMYMRWYLNETIESVIHLHEEAFKELQGVPAVVTYDNMTTVGFHRGPGEVWINPRFKAFAEDYGFDIVILNPGAKDRHGMVERPFHYVEHNFLAGREFDDLEDLNRRGDLWRHTTAHVRIHGTLRERPIDRLVRERPFLKPLPSIACETWYREVDRRIHRDFCVRIDSYLYSASPQHIGKKAKVRLYKEHLELWVEGVMDCRHAYNHSQNKRQVLPEHEQIFKKLTFQSAVLEAAFLRLGETAKAYYEGLRTHKGAAAGYHLQRILKMADRYGSDVVAGALSYAQCYGAYSADSILRVIHGQALRHKGKNLPVTPEVPENIRQWLRACAVERQDLCAYDRLLAQLQKGEKDEKDPR